MSKKKSKIITPILNHYHDNKPIKDGYCNEKDDEIQNYLKKLYSSSNKSLFLDNNDKNLNNINIFSFRETINDNENTFVYKVEYNSDGYYIITGLYSGYLKIGNIKLVINTGYDDYLLQRMLNVANNIYFDNQVINSGTKNNSDTLSLLLEYMFLMSFKNAFSMGLPTEFVTIKKSDMNIKGKINFQDYIIKDYFRGDRITYAYNERQFVQIIVDVLYLAFSSIPLSSLKKINPNSGKYLKQLKQLYSGKRPSIATINKVEKAKSINNPTYSKYKKVLFYAKYILVHKGLIFDDKESSINGISGFLLDISELWEIYIANILSTNLPSYKVTSQMPISIYKETFFRRYNYPDIILENDHEVIILDAKFKKMNFDNKDVDRDDLNQIHSYIGFFKTLGKNVTLGSLVYPASKDMDVDSCVSSLYGGLSDTKLLISYIKIGSSYKEMIDNEKAFIERLIRSK